MSDNEYVDVLLYSDDSSTRRHVMYSVGRRAAKGQPLIRWDETATAPAAIEKVQNGAYALMVLDGEAAKVGGMALGRQLKEEVFDCPPTLILIGRPEDTWLARWSMADGYVNAPYDPLQLQQAVAALLEEK